MFAQKDRLKLIQSCQQFYSKWVINIVDFPFSRPYKFHQYIATNIINTRATNVWDEVYFIHQWHVIKTFLKYSVLQENRWKLLEYLWQFFICEGKLWICAGCPLKEIYRANKITSLMFFIGGNKAQVLDTSYQERSPYWCLLYPF